MKGWKTWTAALLVAVGGVLEYLGSVGVLDPHLCDMISKLIYTLGGAFGLVGIGSKVDKLRKENRNEC
jgi:hypothetical protein